MKKKKGKIDKLTIATLVLRICIVSVICVVLSIVLGLNQGDYLLALELIAGFCGPFVIPYIGQVLLCKFVKNKTAVKCYIWLILLEILSILAVIVAVWFTLATFVGLIFLAIFGIPMVSMYVIDYEILKGIINTTKKKNQTLTETKL